MKKIFMFILACSVTTGVFAEFRFSLVHDFNGYLFSSITPTGLYAQKTVTDSNGNETHNIGVSQNILNSSLLFPVRSSNTGYFAPRGYNFFTATVAPHGFFWNDVNDLRLIMAYATNRFHAHIGVNGGRLVDRIANRGAHPTAFDFLNLFTVDEYWFSVTSDMFGLWFGDQDNPGMVDTYQDFTDWSYQLLVEEFGVNVPGGNVIFNNRGNSSFRDLVIPGNVTDIQESGYFIGSIKLLDHFLDIPITIDLGMDIGNGIDRLINPGSNNLPGQTRIGGGLRVSGENIANIFNFDVTYKMRGGDGNRDDSWDEDLNPGGGFQPDGVGAMSHVLGFAFGLPALVPDLGISLAYTLLFTSYEDRDPLPNTNVPVITKTGPIYSGIDLRLRFTGIEGLRLTFSNNISFARADEPVWNEDYMGIVGQSVRLLGGNDLNRFQSQTWFALYNSFAARYIFSGFFSAGFELVHRTGIFTEFNSNPGRGPVLGEWGKSEKVTTMLQAAVYASFNLSGSAVLQVGPSIWFENNNTIFSNYLDGGPGQTTSWAGGGMGFGIPIRAVFTW